MKEDLLRNNTAATVSEVNTVLSSLNLKEFGDIDRKSGQQGGEDVDDDPVAPALHLPVVVRSTDSQVPLHPHGNDQVDTRAHADPGFKSKFNLANSY